MSYFGNSVPKMHTTREDYKPVIFCVHCCQIPLYLGNSLLRTGLRIPSPLTPRYYQMGAGFIPRLASYWQHRQANLWVVSTLCYKNVPTNWYKKLGLQRAHCQSQIFFKGFFESLEVLAEEAYSCKKLCLISRVLRKDQAKILILANLEGFWVFVS